MSLITINRPKKAVLLDVDGVLLECTEIACRMWNEEHPHETPMNVTDVRGYGVTGTKTDELLPYYAKEELYKLQKPYPGAVEFVRELSAKYDVYFLTAVPDHIVVQRGRQLKRYFPFIDKSHIFYGSVKERFIADFSLDDCPDHILAQYESGAVKHPVIMRRPWNENLSGIMSVYTYDDFRTFLSLADSLGEVNILKPCVVALVGPAGSNKGKLCGRLISRGYKRVTSITTSEEKADEVKGYRHVSVSEFLRLRDEGAFIETTSYAQNYYGIPKTATQGLLDDGINAVTVVDVCGAVALKRIFGERCLTVYVDRNFNAVLDDILNKHMGDELKNRIRWLSAEQKNKSLCELTILNDDSDRAADELVDFLN